MPAASEKPVPKPTPTPKAEKKPWEEDVFGAKKPTPKPYIRKDTDKKAAGVPEEAGETHDALMERNKKIVDRYGEGKKSLKKDKKRTDSKRR